jgi:DNA mismatch endonuclease, patch repair protein
MDTVDKATRSRIMSSVRRKNTRPEVLLRRALHRLGLRFRLHDRNLPGSPDIVLPKYNAVIFVHGCFWHAHGCRLSTLPSTRRDFWLGKFRANRLRDRRNIGALVKQGWRVCVVWQCCLRKSRNDVSLVVARRVLRWLMGSQRQLELSLH